MSNPARTFLAALVAFLLASLLGPPRSKAAEICPEFLPDVCFEDESAFLAFPSLDGLWHRAGSSAIPDPTSIARFEPDGSEARLRQGSSGEILLRYPVVCTGSPAIPTVTIEYRDDGPGARVRVKLIARYLFTSDPKTIYAFDSDDRPSNARLQTWVARIPPPGDDGDASVLHCGSAAYFFEVRLEGTPAGDPRLALLGLRAARGATRPGSGVGEP